MTLYDVLRNKGAIGKANFTLSELDLPGWNNASLGKRANLGSQLAKKIKKHGGVFCGVTMGSKVGGVQIYTNTEPLLRRSI